MTSVNGSYYNDFIRGCQDETLGKIVNFLWREIFGECEKNMEVRDALYIISGICWAVFCLRGSVG